MKLLAGDIGGTKTVLAIYEHDSDPTVPLIESTYPSANHPSLEAIVETFFSERKIDTKDVALATFGVAGPVVGGRATITNLPWTMDEVQMSTRIGLPKVTLINDLVSIASAIPGLPESDLHTINAGTPVENGPIAVVAPGTGLGEAFLVHNGRHYQAYPSEGGHADFGPNNETEVELLQFLQQKSSSDDKPTHVSWERVCSGVGIPNIYDYFKSTDIGEEEPQIAAQASQGGDVTPLIMAAAQRDEPCPICRATLDTFLAILGSEAGNMALKVLSRGGVYLGGGMPPRLLTFLDQPLFMDAFLNKGRLSAVLKDMPIKVILNAKAALYGAASHALLHFHNE